MSVVTFSNFGLFLFSGNRGCRGKEKGRDGAV
jgi:hypothetical protein